MPAECQWPSFSIAFTVLTAFGLRGNFTDSPMTTGIFMILGFLANLQSSYVPVVAQDLLVLRLKLIVLRFCWSEVMTPGILSGAPTR